MSEILHDQIVSTTAQLEQKNAEPLRQLLHGHSEQERDQALTLIKAQYATDAARPNAHLPQIDIQVGAWTNGDNENVLVNGKSVFQSNLNLNTLMRDEYVNGKSAGPAEKVVGEQAKVDVRALTNLLEAGKGPEANQMLTSLSEEERIQALQMAGTMNGADLQHGTAKYGLDVRVSGTKLRQNEITVRRSLPGITSADTWGLGTLLYSETYNPTQGNLKIESFSDKRT